MAVTITNSGIILPRAGETASIAFAFKNQMTNDPIILSGIEGRKHYIEAYLVDPTTKEIAFGDKQPKIYQMPTTIDKDDKYCFHIFETNDIITIKADLELTANDEKPETITIDNDEISIEYNVLYKCIVGETLVYKYFVKNENGNDELRTYDYTNSSIQVDFSREDTKHLAAKDYEFGIMYYNTNLNDEVLEQYTLLEPIKFTIKEAATNAIY